MPDEIKVPVTDPKALTIDEKLCHAKEFLQLVSNHRKEEDEFLIGKSYIRGFLIDCSDYAKYPEY